MWLMLILFLCFGFLVPFLSFWGYRNMCLRCAAWQQKDQTWKTLVRFSISRYKYDDAYSAMLRIEVRPSSYFRCYELLKVDEFSANVTKFTFSVILLNTQITLNYSLKVSFIDIRNNRSLFLLCLLRIFPWIKFFWYSCLMWDKLKKLNYFFLFFVVFLVNYK